MSYITSEINNFKVGVFVINWTYSNAYKVV